MRRSIFMYLFFFAALWIIFQYANEKKIFGAQEKEIALLEDKLAVAEDSLSKIEENAVEEERYFGLYRNENAYSYFEKFNSSTENLESRIEDEVISRNSADGNSLVPFDNATGAYRINKVWVLNHKWILADFTDGERWGELLLTYDIDSDNTIKIENMESLIYPLD